MQWESQVEGCARAPNIFEDTSGPWQHRLPHARLHSSLHSVPAHTTSHRPIFVRGIRIASAYQRTYRTSQAPTDLYAELLIICGHITTQPRLVQQATCG